VLEKYGNDPDLIRLLSNLGAKFSEARGIKPPTTTGLTITDIDAKMTEIKKSEAYNNRMHPGHKAAIDMLSKLHKDKNAAEGKPEFIRTA
jgi:hypothetical protein